MKGGYESIVWVNDKNGKEYACYFDDVANKIRSHEELSETEKAKCLDVNLLIGTERW